MAYLPAGGLRGFNRPNIVPGVKINTFGYDKKRVLVGRSATTAPAFSTNAFATPGDFQLGNAQRNHNNLRNPAFYNEDVNVRKTFTFTESIRLILQADFFNVLDRTILNNPETSLGDGNFGLVSSTSPANTERRGQISARLTF